MAVSIDRQMFGRSPNVSFGRMPENFRMSSGNNAKLVAARKRFRGARTEIRDASHEPSLPPTGPLDGDVQDPSLLRLNWSGWQPVKDVARKWPGSGVYRIRGAGPTLLYIGQRLKAHLENCADAADEQGYIFGAARNLECSHVVNETWLAHQRLEVENDLIAAHILAMGRFPAAQFLG